MIPETETDTGEKFFPIDNFRLHLRYGGHFDGPSMMSKFKQQLETSKRTIEYWSFKPDIGPQTGWKHTHVLLTSKGAAFRAKSMKPFIIDGVSPFIRKVTTEEHLAEIIAYHEDEKKGEKAWSHFPLLGKGAKEKVKIEGPKSSIKSKMLKEVKEKAWKCETEEDLMTRFEDEALASDWSTVRSIWKSKPREPKPNAPDDFPLYGWQKRRIEETSAKAPGSDRKIVVYVDLYGKGGKTDLRKYFIRFVEGTLMLQPAHIYHSATNIEKHVASGQECSHIIFDIEADTKVSTAWYASLESIKSGQIVSVKNNGKMIDFGTPHITVFTNSVPQLERLIVDRWDIRFIGGEIGSKIIERTLDGEQDLVPLVKSNGGDRTFLSTYWDLDPIYANLPKLRTGDRKD